MNTLFLISLVLEAIFGIGFILAPGLLLGPMGVTLNETATTFARLFGSAIISFPVLLFFVRRSDKTEFRKAVVDSLFIYYLVSTILLLITQLNGQMNSMGWSIVGLHILLTLWFGYFIISGCCCSNK
jgi:hypothetical protein